MSQKGILIVLSGFSGAGKGTLVKRLLQTYDNYALSVSMTTRQPRTGERDGIEYFFADKERFESKIAEIEHRDVLPVTASDLGDYTYGQYSPLKKEIVMNEKLIESDSQENYILALSTFFHEGRHAYQYYNLYEKIVEPNSERTMSWRVNLEDLGYKDYGIFGFEEYYTQPIEVDASTFSEEIMMKLDLR